MESTFLRDRVSAQGVGARWICEGVYRRGVRRGHESVWSLTFEGRLAHTRNITRENSWYVTLSVTYHLEDCVRGKCGSRRAALCGVSGSRPQQGAMNSTFLYRRRTWGKRKREGEHNSITTPPLFTGPTLRDLDRVTSMNPGGALKHTGAVEVEQRAKVSRLMVEGGQRRTQETLVLGAEAMRALEAIFRVRVCVSVA